MEGKQLEQYRDFLKDSIRQRIDFTQSDQNRGVPTPPVEKPYPPEAVRIDLPQPNEWQGLGQVDLAQAIGHRRSRRTYRPEPLSRDEVSFLLWAVQGVRGETAAGHAYRTVPSAGCRHALETYLAVLAVEGLEVGIYRYLPLTHQLLFEFPEERLSSRLVEALLRQSFAGRAALTFIWTAIPYRMEWRYGLAAHKVIAIDAGHVCQNLYLACEAIGAGTCAIAAYDQEALDRLLQVDGREEFAIYAAPVGRAKD